MIIVWLLANLPGTQECQGLLSSANQLTCAAQMATHEGRIKELQEELTTAYKEKGKLAEDLLQAGAANTVCCDDARLHSLVAARKLTPCS